MKFLRTLVPVLLLTAATAGSCTIPVFRYALDRWRADSFSIAADEAWKKSEAGKKAEALISKSGANLVWSSEVAPGPEARLIWARGTTPVGPEELKPANLRALTTSPLRDEIAKRILAGESAVWVMVDSGGKDQDGAFAKRLAKRLKYLESVAAIPPQDPDDPDSRLGPGPALRVGFSMLRVGRDDPKEQLLARLIAGPLGKDLLEGDQPFAAPVFGRGRVLGAWTAADLDDAGIDEVSLFLLGACSCRVKAQNPGWDLLLNVDWDERLMQVEIAGDDGEGETPPPSSLTDSEASTPAGATP